MDYSMPDRTDTPDTPLISVDAVQTKAGWIGQVRVGRTIVHEVPPSVFGCSSSARDMARQYVLDRLTSLLAPEGLTSVADVGEIVDERLRRVGEQLRGAQV